MKNNHWPGGQHTPELLGRLTAYDFGGKVKIRFEDGSRVIFRYAFARIENGFTVVYTEHCDYHVFRLGPEDVLTGEIWPPDQQPDPRGEEYWDAVND